MTYGLPVRVPFLRTSGISPDAMKKQGLEERCAWRNQDKGFHLWLASCKRLREKFPELKVVCDCGHSLVIREFASDFSDEPTYVAASYPHQIHGTDCLAQKRSANPQPLRLVDITAQDMTIAAPSDEAFERIRIRLRPVTKLIHRSIAAAFNDQPKSEAGDALVFKTIFGLYQYMAECAGLCRWHPNREFVTEFDQILPWMRHRCEAIHSFCYGLEQKIIFSDTVCDNRQASLAACRASTPSFGSLKGASLLFAIAHYTGNKTPGSIQFQLSAPGSSTEPKDLKKTEYLGQKLANEKHTKLFAEVKKRQNARIMMALLLREEGGQLSWDDGGWSIVDRFGNVYDSWNELDAGAQLVASEIPFTKPASTFYLVASRRCRPDFVLFDEAGIQYVIEVDPEASNETTARKADRDASFATDGIRAVTWSPAEGIDVVEKLSRSGFRRRKK